MSKFRCLILSLVLGLLSTGLLAGSDWSYHGKTGPAYWGELNPDYIACAEGDRQSPIDLASSTPKDPNLPALTFTYGSAELVWKNNGHTLQAEVPTGKGTLLIGDRAYGLLQFHIHTPSEHLVDGKAYPLELHLVHRNEQQELAVVGVFFAEGAENKELAALFAAPPAKEGQSKPLGELDLNFLLPQTHDTFRYDGSLTTPKCSQGVAWHVMIQNQEASAEQLQAIKAIFSGEEFPDGNRRPVQKLNDRVVKRD